ncbi:cytochrome P450 86B1 [Mercurialis annua]|uniref:cytochrome P450 86B1 n=1 Tax=Mercurialis annua TaxID=3986 RepID=UPI002160CD96|nr:cytochrome P450 86B1 [Mercurialis annua]
MTIESLLNHLSFWDLAFALIGFFVFSCVRERIANNGPMLWPVFGIIPTMLLHINDTLNFATGALIRAGGTFRYRGMWMGGAYGVMTADPVNVEYILRTNFKNFPKGKYYRNRFQDLLGDGIFNADGELWKDHRQIAKIEMHSSRFVDHSFRTMRDLVHLKLLKLTEKFVRSGNSFDFQELLLRFTFDNICTAAFGVDPGCLNLDLPEVPFAKAFEEATELTLFRFLVPPFVWKPMKFLGIGFEKKLKSAIDIVQEFADETVKNRKNQLIKLGNLNDHSDLLSRLIDIAYSENVKNKLRFPDEYFRDFCVSFILAGRDTTSVALAWFFWLVHENPDVENKILAEINQILSHRTSENRKGVDIVFTVSELKKMVYLQAALSESMRLYPSVPNEIKEVIQDDILPDGSEVKRGARILYCIYAMARMESIWGKDCLEFKPERWIKDGNFISENQFKYAVFNGGPRLCLGKKYAYMQMKMVAASILLRYCVEVVEGQNVVPKITTTLYMKNGLMVNIKPRMVQNGNA